MICVLYTFFPSAHDTIKTDVSHSSGPIPERGAFSAPPLLSHVQTAEG